MGHGTLPFYGEADVHDSGFLRVRCRGWGEGNIPHSAPLAASAAAAAAAAAARLTGAR